jgi:hypothetical protein
MNLVYVVEVSPPYFEGLEHRYYLPSDLYLHRGMPGYY